MSGGPRSRDHCSAVHFLLVGEPQLSLALSLNERDFIFACTLQVPSTKTATRERGTMATMCTRRREGLVGPVGRACTRVCFMRTPPRRTSHRSTTSRRRTTRSRTRRSHARLSLSRANLLSSSAPDLIKLASPRRTM